MLGVCGNLIVLDGDVMSITAGITKKFDHLRIYPQIVHPPII